MISVNRDLVRFFEDNFVPAAVGMVGGTDLLSMAIRTAQKSFTDDGKPSLWSHSFILGDMRRDLNCPAGLSAYIFESTISLDPMKMNVRNGAQENWIGKWCHGETENAVIIDFGLSLAETDSVLAIALQLVCDQIQYPVDELLTMWLKIIFNQKWEAGKENIHALVCTALVRYCYRYAKRDFLSAEIPLQGTVPENIIKAGKEKGKVILWERK